jgi:hypothetical protein
MLRSSGDWRASKPASDVSLTRALPSAAIRQIAQPPDSFDE